MQSGAYYTAAGGGGRVAIWSGAALWEPGLKSSRWTATETKPDAYSGTIDVAGGPSLSPSTEQSFAGAAGTVRFMTVSKKPGLVIVVY